MRVLKVGWLDCRGHEMVELRILRRQHQVRSRITTLDFRRPDLAWLRTWLSTVQEEPCGRVLEQREVWDRGLIFKDLLIYAPKLPIHMQEFKKRWQDAWVDEKGTPEKTHTQRESIQDVEREVGGPRKNTKAVFNFTEIGLGKPKPTSSWKMGKGIKKASTSKAEAKGKRGQKWASCWKIQSTSKWPAHSSWYRKDIFNFSFS